MPTDGQLICLMSHTLGSIGQLLKEQDVTYMNDTEKELLRIYLGYIEVIQASF